MEIKKRHACNFDFKLRINFLYRFTLIGQYQEETHQKMLNQWAEKLIEWIEIWKS